MKKLIVMMMLVIAMTASMASCSSQTEEPSPTPEEVCVKLDYAFFEQGSMSRSGESVYQEFFTSYIQNKLLTPELYYLTFMDQKSQWISNVSGTWGGSIIRLKEGTYHVQGTSTPKSAETASLPSKYINDKAYLSFDENVDITKDAKTLTLTAKYNCYLLLFNAEDIKSLKTNYSSYDTEWESLGNIYYIFVNNDVYDGQNLRVKIEKVDGTKIEVKIGGMGFEKGKYYYFNDMTNSFDIDPMVNGN